MARDEPEHELAGHDTRALVINAAATRMVGELLAAADAEQVRMADPETDAEFADHLIDYELALMAFGEEPLRIALRIAVLTIARDSLRTYAEIRALPETGSGHAGRVGAAEA